jgi:hypothetical protein
MYKGICHKQIIEALERAIKGESFTQAGICLIMQSHNPYGSEVLDDLRNLMSEVIRELGFHSNIEMFPIAPPSDTTDELFVHAEASLAYIKNKNLWDHNDEYCQRRIEVAKQMIAILKGNTTTTKDIS